MNNKISVVVPMYNEEEVANEFYTRTSNVLKNLPFDYEIISEKEILRSYFS